MTIAEVLTSVRYVTDTQGETTDVLIPLTTWKTLLGAWQQMMQQMEDQEDRSILQAWLEQRAQGKIKMIPLEDLEQELVADGLLPG